MSKKKTTKKPARSTPANVMLTVTERDAIDHAKSRLRGYVTILERLLPDAQELTDSPDVDEALDMVVEEMGAAINHLDETFETADARGRR